MPTPYHKLLLQALQPEGEIAQLQYDVQNAPPAMQQIATKLFNLVTNLTYHCATLTEELVRLNVLQRYQPTPPRVAQQRAAAQQTISPFPAPPTLSLPHVAQGPGVAPGDVAPSDVAQVVITAQGTRVIPPAGSASPPVVLPPHTPVNLAQVQSPPAPPPAEDGVSQVILPRGGSLPPEVQAALNTRQGATPETP